MKEPLLPLTAWVERKHPLPVRFWQESSPDKPTKEWGVFVGIEEAYPLHEALSIQWQGLEQAIEKTRAYLQSAGEIISGLSRAWLDSEEREMILSEIGMPPVPCLPIYIITTKDHKQEDVQYVGKTKNETRFKGGHAVSIKLHDPQFDQLEKKIYRCSVWFYFNGEYIALEWIKPKSLALELLDAIETNLISSLKPPLNSQKKGGLGNSIGFNIHIQNFCGPSILNDTFIWNAD